MDAKSWSAGHMWMPKTELPEPPPAPPAPTPPDIRRYYVICEDRNGARIIPESDLGYMRGDLGWFTTYEAAERLAKVAARVLSARNISVVMEMSRITAKPVAPVVTVSKFD